MQKVPTKLQVSSDKKWEFPSIKNPLAKSWCDQVSNLYLGFLGKAKYLDTVSYSDIIADKIFLRTKKLTPTPPKNQ